MCRELRYDLLCIVEIGGKIRGVDSELRTRGGAEMVDDVLQTHPCAVGFAVCAISCNVGSGDEGKVEELAVNVGFVFPRVDHCTTYFARLNGCFESCCVGAFSACGIDEDAALAECVKERGIGQMVGGVRAFSGQGCVERDDLTLFCKVSECVGFPLGWVAVERAEAFGTECTRNG